VFRNAFDYLNQIDYLGAIAEHMCRLNTFTVDYENVYRWTKEYFDSIGIEHDFQKLITHFVDNKVFCLEGNSIYFRYNIFLSFFIVHRMQRSSEFKEWLFAGHRYKNYLAEIDIYCGLSRQDGSVLELLSKQFAELGAMLESYVKPLSSTDRLE